MSDQNIKNLLNQIISRTNHSDTVFLDQKRIDLFIIDLFSWLFPERSGENKSEQQLTSEYIDLKSKLNEIFFQFCQKTYNYQLECELFFSELTHIYNKLIKDAESFMKHDPAAKSLSEVILCYPGFKAICCYRIAHHFYTRNIPLVARIISEWAHKETGIDIHPGAQIGENFFIDHGTGVVIGETAIIGNDVRLFQGVTLGALSVHVGLKGVKRHPTIEDNVVIYANPTILGGETVIGKNSVIGGSVWLTKSLEENSVVFHKSEVKKGIKNKNDYLFDEEALVYEI